MAELKSNRITSRTRAIAFFAGLCLLIGQAVALVHAAEGTHVGQARQLVGFRQRADAVLGDVDVGGQGGGNGHRGIAVSTR